MIPIKQVSARSLLYTSFLVAALVLFASPSAQAATATWTGTTNSDFNTGGNWSGGTGTGGIPGTGDNATFTGVVTHLNPNVSGSLTVLGLTYSSSTTSGYTLSASSGQSLTLTNTGTGASAAINAANTSGTNTISAPLILGGANATQAAFTQAGGGTLSITGNISSTNTEGVLINGLGTVILGGTNSYTGTTSVTVGTLQLNGTNSSSGTTAVGTVSGSNTTTLILGTGTNGGLASGQLSTNPFNQGASEIIEASDNTSRTISSNLTFLGNSGNSIQLGATQGAGTGKGNLDFTNVGVMNLAGPITINNSTVVTLENGSFTGQILAKAGLGTLVLNNIAYFPLNQGINLAAGTIQLAGSTSLLGGTSSPSTNFAGAVNITGGSLDLNGISTSSGALTGSGGTILNNGTGTSTLTFGSTANGTKTYSGAIIDNNNAGSGKVALNFNPNFASLIQVLSGVNTYTGVTTVGATNTGDELSVGIIGNGGATNGNMGSATNAAANLVFNGGGLQYTGVTASTDRNFTINTSKTATFDVSVAGTNLTWNGASTATNGIVTKVGLGTLTLAGTNLYTGTTTVENGTLSAGTNAPSGSGGAFGNAASAIALGDAASITSNLSPSLLTGGAVTVARNITVGSSNSATTGVYTIGGNSANVSTFSGAETLNQSLTVAQVTGGTTTLAGNITSGASGTQTLKFNNAGAVSQTNGVIGAGTGTIAVTQTGAGTTTLSRANTYTGGTTVTAGKLLVSNTTGSGTGSGALTVARGGGFGGSGIVTAPRFDIGTSGSGTAQVQVGNGTDTISTLSLTGTTSTGTPNNIANANLTFNLDIGSTNDNELVVANSTILFGSAVTLKLNLLGSGGIPPNRLYVLIAGNVGAGNATSQYTGLTYGSSTGTLSTGLLTQIAGSNLTLSGGIGGSLYLYQNTTSGADYIEVQLVPEPSTWAMMLGGLAVLIFWQRRKNHRA